ncbi:MULTISPECIES: hypothetical protein [Pseudomonas]|uniref:Uncharacterized protein n=1 Tax=Pseudomonas abyssi TaxID=170540 RepID=A0A2A3MNE2_9PSED|nr:hypothetical protein [Pseudomonas abyssi]MAC98792.1 hypothetical protein [Pseudomonadales bacterium]PBK06064.1 hypothetical protein CNQ84_01445 [Pseudomonas abyssi]
MKYFRYWVKATQRIRVAGQPEDIQLLVGSNESKEAAHEQASVLAREIERRIESRGARDEYDAGIKEHVARVLDGSNVVTVCRYGAKILNTDEYTILDLDDYPKRFWDRFSAVRTMGKKERIVFKFEQAVAKLPELGRDFRIYETANGIRVIGKQYLDPADRRSYRLMRKVNVDWLYMILSGKQRCYRARLSPKPYRLGIKTIKVSSPLVCETDEYQNWERMYAAASQDVSVVHYLKSIGKDFSRDAVVRFHDEQCNAHKHFKLA